MKLTADQKEYKKEKLSKEEIIQYLKSDDFNEVTKALQQKWFFQPSLNDFKNIDFLKNIFPCVTVNTRLRIIKLLSRSLLKSKKEAEDFFECLNELYGFEQAKPLLICCSEEFVTKTLQDSNIRLPVRVIDRLFEKYPDVVIKYLKNPKKYLSDYKKFLPKLLKNHSQDFLDIIKYSKIKKNLKFGRASLRSLAKNNPDLLKTNRKLFITSPRNLEFVKSCLKQKDYEELYSVILSKSKYNFSLSISLAYLGCYPKGKRLDFFIKTYHDKYNEKLLKSLHDTDIKTELKYMSNLFTIQEFTTVFEYIFRKPENRFRVDKMMNYLEHYPKKERLGLVIKTYQSIHNKNLLDDVHFAFLKSEKFLILLPRYKNVEIVTKIMHLYKKNSEKYFQWACCLPLDVSFKIFEDAIKVSKTSSERRRHLIRMIHSCSLYNSQLFLSKFISYYCINFIHSNTQSMFDVLNKIVECFKIEDMNDSCWLQIFDMMVRLHVKNELLPSGQKLSLEGMMLKKSLQRSLVRINESPAKEEYKVNFDKVVDMYLEFSLKNTLYTPSFDSNIPLNIQINGIVQLFKGIQRKYPDEIWIQSSKTETVTHLIKNLYRCLIVMEKNSKDGAKKIIEITQNDPWLTEFIRCKLTTFKERDDEFEDLMKRLNSEFYELMTENRPYSKSDCHRQILSGEACQVLKINTPKVQANLDSYVSACQDLLCANRRKGAPAAKKFCRRLKEYDDIKKQVIERCKVEIAKSGSLTILMLLGVKDEAVDAVMHETLDTEVSPCSNMLDDKVKEKYRLALLIPVAINASNPPANEDYLTRLFTSDCVHLVIPSIVSYGRKIKLSSASSLVDKLMNSDSYILQSSGVALAFEVFNYDELKLFLTNIWSNGHKSTVARTIMKKALQRFKTDPCNRSWTLMEICIKGLRVSDDRALKVLATASGVSEKFAEAYVKMLLDRVEELAADNLANQKWKEKWIVIILSRINSKLALSMTKEMIMNILFRYYFRAESVSISNAAKSFANSAFCRSKVYDRLAITRCEYYDLDEDEEPEYPYLDASSDEESNDGEMWC